MVHWLDVGNQWMACSFGPKGNTCDNMCEQLVEATTTYSDQW